METVSDLRNKFSEIESIVNTGSPVFLTKNGYGTMVVLSMEEYSRLTEGYDLALMQAEVAAQSDDKRYSRDEVYRKIKEHI